VKAKFPPREQLAALPASPQPSNPADTREIATSWFRNLEQGKFDDALKLVDPDVIWDNIPPVPGVSDLAPWLGSYRGLPAVRWNIEGRKSRATPRQVQAFLACSLM